MPRWSKTIRSRLRKAGESTPSASPSNASVADWPGPPASTNRAPRRGRCCAADALHEQRHPPRRRAAAVERHAQPRAAEHERAAALEAQAPRRPPARDQQGRRGGEQGGGDAHPPIMGAATRTGLSSAAGGCASRRASRSSSARETVEPDRGRGALRRATRVRTALAAQPPGDPLGARSAARRRACADRIGAAWSARDACRRSRISPLTRIPGMYSTASHPQHRRARVQVERPAAAAQPAPVQVEAAATQHRREELDGHVEQRQLDGADGAAARAAARHAPPAARPATAAAAGTRRTRRAAPAAAGRHGLAAEEPLAAALGRSC